MADKEQKQKIATAEREARERYAQAIEEIREGCWRFSSKVRGQAQIILDELVDPDGESMQSLADFEGDVGALALATPLDLITFETWLLGQIGDEDALDLDISSHRELWFNFGAWIGETLRLRHGGHWLFAGDEPKSWRLGFSKILLEIVPHLFAEQLLMLQAGCVKKLLLEVDRLDMLHHEQVERDGGKEIDRFTPQHYIRMHTVPLGQWMVMDFKTLDRLWNKAAVRDLSKAVRKAASRMGSANSAIIERVAKALAEADQEKPIAQQTGDRGLFEAVAQIVALKRTAAPLAVDVLQEMVLPALHIGIPDKFPPLDEEDLTRLRKGVELFALFVDIVPHKYPADDEGFLGAIPHDQLSTPYRDRSTLEIGKGDWVIINPKYLHQMLLEYDSKRLMDKYDEFLKYLRSEPKAPRRRDDGRMLAETVARAIADLRSCVGTASKGKHTLLFRMLPPPA